MWPRGATVSVRGFSVAVWLTDSPERQNKPRELSKVGAALRSVLPLEPLVSTAELFRWLIFIRITSNNSVKDDWLAPTFLTLVDYLTAGRNCRWGPTRWGTIFQRHKLKWFPLCSLWSVQPQHFRLGIHLISQRKEQEEYNRELGGNKLLITKCRWWGCSNIRPGCAIKLSHGKFRVLFWYYTNRGSKS